MIQGTRRNNGNDGGGTWDHASCDSFSNMFWMQPWHCQWAGRTSLLWTHLIGWSFVEQRTLTDFCIRLPMVKLRDTFRKGPWLGLGCGLKMSWNILPRNVVSHGKTRMMWKIGRHTIPSMGIELKMWQNNIPCRFFRILFALWISFLHSDMFSWADVMFSSTLWKGRWSKHWTRWKHFQTTLHCHTFRRNKLKVISELDIG